MTLAQRFAGKIDRNGPGGCWLWTGHVDRGGYGRIRLGGRTEPVGYAHRVAYELYVGLIPEGYELDHLCRVRRCANPDHLEPVTRAVNIARGESPPARTIRDDRCKRGHEFTANAYVYLKTGARRCRECIRFRRSGGAA